MPHFTYDCNTDSDYNAQAGTHYYETEMVQVQRDGKTEMEERQVMKTRWTPVSGRFRDSFDDILVLASKNVDEKLMKLSFDMKDLVPYQKDYIYSFLAENNSLSKEECWNTAQGVIEAKLRQEITKAIGADEVRGLNFRTLYSAITFKSILLPVWMSSYQFKNKTYKFMINGQSGQVKGQAPVSALRVIVSILVSLLITLICTAVNPIFGIIVLIASIITLICLAYKNPKKLDTEKK